MRTPPITDEIVVLGGNCAGINLVHHLLRQIIPKLSEISSSAGVSYHVTLVTPNTYFLFKVAAPGALINASLIPSSKIFKSIPEAFQQYGPGESRVSFLRGKAVGLDPAAREVAVEIVGGGSQKLKFDSLFICTGTTSASALWTLHDDHETVLIAGGGPVGVETAGEIVVQYPEIKITLVAGGDVLDKLKPGAGVKAKKFLDDAGVEVLTNVRVMGSTASELVAKIELSDSSSKTVDLFIDARGMSKINSEFLPKNWLDESGRVTAKDAYFRVKGDGKDNVSGIYVLGDIVSGSTNTALELDAMVPVAASSFAVDIAAELGETTVSSGGSLSWIPGFGSNALAQKEFKPMQDTVVISFGPSGGVGLAMGFSMPSFLVKKAKAERFLVELVEPTMSGAKQGKA
ncbi:hypothetical protein BCR34DRAFT_608690 [Clohesyomyces aquaticus]|uniref:FAD/NAD(P)-binding domain-containing protein n=1 Tax=Clohesyomyces aquaticus TaxID=1231657 RepID=A0A1Y1Y5P9_9PLEO|nr:hypothetical protein BCR34DRAFT_608690 [Clohesyomyces aquaticus]